MQSGDLLLPNHDFAAGLDSWRPLYDAAADLPEEPVRHPVTVSDRHAYLGHDSARLTADTGARAGIASAGVPIEPGQGYAGFVRVRCETGSVGLELRFYDPAGWLVTTTYPARSRTHGGWESLTVAGRAPADAADLVLVVTTDPDRPTTAYVDDARLTARWTELGPQIHNAAINGATLGRDAAGRPILYAVVTGAQGHDARLVGIDPDGGVVGLDLPLPGALGAWTAVAAADGSIVIGTYSGGRLYHYRPGADEVTDLGRGIDGDTFVWTLAAAPNGTVYAGGYPSGGVVGWHPDGGFHPVGPVPLCPPEQYVRSLAYDSDTGLLFAGIGAHAALMVGRPDRDDSWVDVLPAEHRADAFGYNLTAGAGHVVVRLTPSEQTFVLRITERDGTIEATTVADLGATDYPGASPLVDGRFYVSVGGRLRCYDLAADDVVELGVDLGIEPRAWGVVDADSAGLPALLGVSRSGTIASYRIETGTLSHTEAHGLPTAPTDIQSIANGPDGNIYSTGFLIGGMGVYTPMRGRGVEHHPVGQAEGLATLGDALYLGIYPHARIQRYLPATPFAAGRNPRELRALHDYGQDRPYGMLAAPDGKLYIGTMAAYGRLPGALTVYDPTTERFSVHADVVPDQSIHTLAYRDGIVYGGSLIWGGLGVEPTRDAATFFAFDPDSGGVTHHDLPVPGLRAVFGVSVGPDDRLWMLAERYLLIFDPDGKEWAYVAEAFPHVDYTLGPRGRLTALDADLLLGRDEQFYGVIRGREFFRLDPATKAITTLWNEGASRLTADEFGNVYFVTGGNRLLRYAPHS